MHLWKVLPYMDYDKKYNKEVRNNITKKTAWIFPDNANPFTSTGSILDMFTIWMVRKFPEILGW